MKRLTFICCCLLVLAGCSSSPAKINYYVLGSATHASNAVETGKPAVVLEHLELAAFLRQPGLVMQTSQNEMRISKSHLWAEALDDALPKALQKALQHRTSDYSFYLKAHDWVKNTDYRLRLRVDGLHPNESGEVICYGRFQVIPTKNEGESLVKDFHFKLDLDQNGYPHAVGQLGRLVEMIAGDIVNAMKEEFDIAAEPQTGA